MKTLIIFIIFSTFLIASINTNEIGTDFFLKNVPILGVAQGTIKVLDFTDTTVNLKWNSTYSRTRHYLIVHNMNKETSRLIKKFVTTKTKKSNTVQYRITELEPGCRYKFEVLCLMVNKDVFYDLDFDRLVSKEILTDNPKEKPYDLKDLLAYDVTFKTVTLQWHKTKNIGKTLTTYIILYKEIVTGIQKTIYIYSDSEYPHYKITGLKPGGKYNIRVWALNNKGNSNQLLIKKLILKHPLDSTIDRALSKKSTGQLQVLKSLTTDTTSVKLKWNNSENSAITKYEIFVVNLSNKSHWYFATVNVKSKVLTCTVDKLILGKRYKFVIIAIDGKNSDPLVSEEVMIKENNNS